LGGGGGHKVSPSPETITRNHHQKPSPETITSKQPLPAAITNNHHQKPSLSLPLSTF